MSRLLPRLALTWAALLPGAVPLSAPAPGVAAGRYLDRPELDRILAGVAAFAQGAPVSPTAQR